MKGSTTPSDYSTRAQINASKEKGVAAVTYEGNPKTTATHRESIYTFLDLGVQVEKRFLTKVRSVHGYERVYDNKKYFVSVVIYPKGTKIFAFNKILEEVEIEHRGLLLPVHVLVNSGVFGNWFALYFRKDFKLREGLIWQG